MSRKKTDADIARDHEAALQLDEITRLRIEKTLAELGHNPGEIDGVFDDTTRSAIRGFQTEEGFTPTGYLDEVTFGRMLNIGILR